VGLVHDAVQLDIRNRGLQASWLDSFVVHHFPDPERRQIKTRQYRQRLQCAIKLQSSFYRYHWFRGYMDFLEGYLDQAVENLSKAAAANSPDFPVECLNSGIVLAEVYAQRGEEEALDRVLSQASGFHRKVVDDFEVQINFRLGRWLSDAREHCRTGELTKIRAYRFAC